MSGSRPVLVVNCGSSSLKYQLLDAETGVRAAVGLAERIGEAGSSLTHAIGRAAPATREMSLPDHAAAVTAMLHALRHKGPGLGGLVAIGHRVVHGGTRFTAPTLIDDEVEAAIERLVPLAPLHNPANLVGIRALRHLMPRVPHVAVFDTAFHATIPPMAATYALPADLAAEHGIRRFGFHGSSHAYVTRRAAAMLGVPVDEVNLVTCHIGNGASVTAVRGGRSVDTSMGLTPLEGLVMGTRSGDVDPGALLHLVRSAKLTIDDLDDVLNRRSGLTGLAGAGDVRTVRAAAASGDQAARLALDVYAYRLRKYIGSYLAVVPDVHGIVFTAGVGENDADLREEVCQPLVHLGVRLDAAANRSGRGERFVDAPGSAPRVLVVPTDEEAEIAGQTLGVVRDQRP